MIAFSEVKASPSGWPEEEDMDIVLDDVELAISNLISVYRNRYPRERVIEALNAQAGLLVGDDGWIRDKAPAEPEPDSIADEPEDAPTGETEEAAQTDPTAA